MKMAWPEGFCDGTQKLLLVANVVLNAKKPKLPEIILVGEDPDYHVIHLQLDIDNNTIYRYVSVRSEAMTITMTMGITMGNASKNRISPKRHFLVVLMQI